MDTSNFVERFGLMAKQLYENYDTIADYSSNLEEKTILRDSGERKCRFCGRKEGEVTFDKDAHALSNLISNNRIFSMYECDECNGEYFKVIESNFAEYMKLRHTLSQTHGKKGVPSYKPDSQSFSRIDVKGDFTAKMKEDEDPIAVIDEEKHLIHFKGKRTYVPNMVYKCLLKMALTVMPEGELSNVKNAMDYLMGRVKYNCRLPVLYRQYSGIQPFGRPICFLYKRKEDRPIKNVPQYLFLLAYSNFVFQMHMPFCDGDKFLQGNEINMTIVPTPEDLKQIVKHETLWLESDKKVVNEEVLMDMHFDSFEEKDLIKGDGEDEIVGGQEK